MKSAQSCKSKEKGFTLVELMIAMAVGGIVMAAIMTSFIAQHRSYVAQDDVIEMQQNARVAMEMLTRDIRSAGYDTNKLGAGITTAGVNNLVFTRDDGSGVLETIRYTLFDPFGQGNGLGRDSGTGLEIVAENVSQLEFFYLDGDGNPTSDLGKIYSIRVSILVNSSNPQKSFINNRIYYPGSNLEKDPLKLTWPSPSDNFLRRLIVNTIKCRNLGL